MFTYVRENTSGVLAQGSAEEVIDPDPNTLQLLAQGSAEEAIDPDPNTLQLQIAHPSRQEAPHTHIEPEAKASNDGVGGGSHTRSKANAGNQLGASLKGKAGTIRLNCINPANNGW